MENTCQWRFHTVEITFESLLANDRSVNENVFNISLCLKLISLWLWLYRASIYLKTNVDQLPDAGKQFE